MNKEQYSLLLATFADAVAKIAETTENASLGDTIELIKLQFIICKEQYELCKDTE